MMSLVQEPQIAGWNLKEADFLRKSVAKKDKKLYEELTKKFFDNAKEKNLSSSITNYFWNVLVKTQAGYSFCAAHCLAYSIIGLQNMNLAFKYPIIFWNTANLIVDSSGIDDGEEDEEEEQEAEIESNDDDDEEDSEGEEVKEKAKRNKKTVNYGKVASAIGKFRARGINILPPDINNSTYTFSPNVENNSITYGLRGITRISNDLIKEIIKNRPFNSLEDFLQKVKTNKLQILNLIKSGAFDSLRESREKLMEKYINLVADKKQRLTLQNMQMLINYKLIPEQMVFYAKLFQFNKFLKKNKEGNFYKLNESAINFIDKNFDIDLIVDGDKIYQKDWDATYKSDMDPMRAYLKENSQEMLDKLNKALFDEVWEKYAQGTISKWEMDSISFYYHDHELANSTMELTNFFELPEQPIVDYVCTSKNGQEIEVMKLFLIAGTVIDKNKLKNTVTLLTPDGVVNVKIYKNQYSLFDKQLSEVGEDGKKHVLERGWFSKGTLLLIQGLRRGDNFVAKRYKKSIYPAISKINGIRDDGSFALQFERMEVEG